MKKIKTVFLLLMAFFIISTGQSQTSYKVSDEVPTTVKLTGKYYAVITFLETKDFYKPGMTEDEFIKATTSCLEDETLVEIFTPYMSKIYKLHLSKINSNEVYDKVDGNDFAILATSLEKYMQDPNVREELRFKKPKWFNWLRKVIDWIDDHWKE